MPRGDIQVDTARLRELSRQLDLLRHEFESIEDRVDGYSGAAGRSGPLGDALEDLAGNWSKKRKEVVAQLTQLADLAVWPRSAWGGSPRPLREWQPPTTPSTGQPN